MERKLGNRAGAEPGKGPRNSAVNASLQFTIGLELTRIARLASLQPPLSTPPSGIFSRKGKGTQPNEEYVKLIADGTKAQNHARIRCVRDPKAFGPRA